MKELSQEEVNKLSQTEKWEYWDSLRQFKWESKSFLEKKSEVMNDLNFLFSKGDPKSLFTFEDTFELALNKNISEEEIRNSYGANILREVVEIQKRLIPSEQFTYFWATESPFSQWHKSNFYAPSCMLEVPHYKKKFILAGNFPEDEQEYSSAEQFMMYQKAIIFLDIEIAEKIMQTDNVRKIKELGRKVKNFDDRIWKYYRSKIVYTGNKEKFIQNEKLQMYLSETIGTTLVEASPYDTIWGIGLSEDNANARNRKKWQGKNLLGEILTQLRIEIIGFY